MDLFFPTEHAYQIAVTHTIPLKMEVVLAVPQIVFHVAQIITT